MNRPRTDLRCEGCGVEITWSPILVKGKRYCCQVCAAGGECRCGYEIEDEEDAPGVTDG